MNVKPRIADAIFPAVVAIASVLLGTLLVALLYHMLNLPFSISAVFGYACSSILAILIITSISWDTFKTVSLTVWDTLKKRAGLLKSPGGGEKDESIQ